jgi:hypothetical protein
MRGAGAAALAAVLATVVSTGVNKVLADFSVVCPWLVVGSLLAGQVRVTWLRWAILAGVAAVVFGVFLWFFQATQATRVGSGASTGYCPAINAAADRTNFMVRYLSDDGQVLVLGLSSYLTQGYYALDLALHEPFVPMFGAGHSEMLSRQVGRLLNDPAWEDRSYPARIEKYGWDRRLYWSSLYTWIASDVSFTGTLVVLFVVGRLFALTWLETLDGRNPFAVVMFSQLLILLYYASCNNQCFQSGESLSAFWLSLVCWLASRGRPAAAAGAGSA